MAATLTVGNELTKVSKHPTPQVAIDRFIVRLIYVFVSSNKCVFASWIVDLPYLY